MASNEWRDYLAGNPDFVQFLRDLQRDVADFESRRGEHCGDPVRPKVVCDFESGEVLCE